MEELGGNHHCIDWLGTCGVIANEQAESSSLDAFPPVRRLNAVFHLAPSVTLLPEGVRLGRSAGRRYRWFERGLCRFAGTTGESLSFTSENGEFAHSFGSLPSDEVQNLFREITNQSKHPLDRRLRCHMDAGRLLPIGRHCRDMDFVGWGNHTRDLVG